TRQLQLGAEHHARRARARDNYRMSFHKAPTMGHDPGLAAIPPCGDNYSWEQCPHEKGAPLEGAFLFPAGIPSGRLRSFDAKLKHRKTKRPARTDKCRQSGTLCIWAWEELNFRPHAYQACALTN